MLVPPCRVSCSPSLRVQTKLKLGTPGEQIKEELDVAKKILAAES